MENDEYLKSQGIIGHNEQYETLYLAEEEIEKFMANYLKENPGTEIETRYINHPPVQMTQNIEVRWLRPETPEIPPIIIKEVNTIEPELPPIIIIEKPKEKEHNVEPVIIREKPPFIVIPEPKIAYVQNLTRKDVKQEHTVDGKAIKIEHVRSDSNGSFSNTNLKNRYEYDEQFKRDNLYSFEEHASVVDEYEEYDEVPDDTFRSKMRLEDEEELRLYEEKLKQTLYEEYLLRLERERLERKLSRSGVFEERLRERSISQERMSHLFNKYPSGRSREEEQRLRQVREHDLEHHIIREQQTQSLTSQLSETSTFRNVKFSRVTNQDDLKRYNHILNDTNYAKFQDSNHLIDTSLSQVDSVPSEYAHLRHNDFYNIRQANMADGNFNINELGSDSRTRYKKDYQTTSSANMTKQMSFDNSSSNDFRRIPRTESQKRYFDDLRAYELYNDGKNLNQKNSDSNSLLKNNSNNNNNNLSTSGSGIRRHRITTIKKYYSNIPNQSLNGKTVYVNSSN